MPEQNVTYKYFKAEIKGVNKETGEVDMFIPVSSGNVDRDEECIEPMAFKKTLAKFMKHPVLVASHDYRDLTNQIGEWSKLKLTDNGMEGKPKYYVNEGNEQADWGFNLASKGMAAFSIGFIPKSWEDGDGVKSPRRTYKEVELLEISQVIVPSNREAIQALRSKSVNPVVNEICDAVEKESVTKPEETEEYFRVPIPKEEGKHEGHRIRTITISADEGIKSLYCGEDKVVITYLFSKDEKYGWTMAKAKAWVKEHSKVASQAQIKDEIDYLNSLIAETGLNEENKPLAKELAQNILRITGSDMPEKIESKKEPQIINPHEYVMQRVQSILNAK